MPIYSRVTGFLFIGDQKEVVKKIILDKIELFLDEQNVACEGYSIEGLVEKIYVGSFEFQFLNKYIYDDNVEKINGNSWDCIFVNYSDGSMKKNTRNFWNSTSS